MSIDYIGRWMDYPDMDVSLKDVAETIHLVGQSPMEYNFTVDEIFEAAEKRFGYESKDILGASFVNGFITK